MSEEKENEKKEETKASESSPKDAGHDEKDKEKAGPNAFPDFKELTGMAGKFLGDIKKSVSEIIRDYKAKRPKPEESHTETTQESQEKTSASDHGTKDKEE